MYGRHVRLLCVLFLLRRRKAVQELLITALRVNVPKPRSRQIGAFCLACPGQSVKRQNKNENSPEPLWSGFLLICRVALLSMPIRNVSHKGQTVPSETFSPETLQVLNRDFETGAPQDVLRWAADTFGERLAVVTSFQPTGIVTLHMLSEIAPRTPVLTLDTGLLFPETYTLIDTLEAQLALNLHRVRPAQTVAEQAASLGDQLWARDPDQCCNLRKVVPLDNALIGYQAWVTGLRRDQSDGRQQTPIVSWDKRYQRVKLCPFATWTEDMIWAYLTAYELPYNALHDQQYVSIGCVPCTQSVSSDETDKRAGRWVGRGKTECGLHTVPAATTAFTTQPTLSGVLK